MNITILIISIKFGISLHSTGDLKRIETVNRLQGLKQHTLTHIELGATDSIKGMVYIERIDRWLTKIK